MFMHRKEKKKRLIVAFLTVIMVTTIVGTNWVKVSAEERIESSAEITEQEDITEENIQQTEETNEDSQEVVEEQTEEIEKTNQENESLSEIQNPEEGDHANSWRYQDGERIASEKSRTVARTVNITQANITRKGIDVSEHNGTINWEKVKASGVEFVILRCGYGTNMTKQDDKQWLRNVQECERLGIPYGVYIYSYATNTERASSEADHVLRLIKGHKLSYPVYFDMEDQSTENSDLASIAQTFCNKIRNAGYPVGVYASLSWWNYKLTDSCFSNWYRWIASWSASKCNYNGQFALWQYLDRGTVSGISGNVDMNYLIGTPADHGKAYEEALPDEVKNGVNYEAHVSNIGWQGNVDGGRTAGTVGENLGIEALKITSKVKNVGIKYSSYTKETGWQDYVQDGNVTGSVGNNRPLEAVKMELTGNDKDNYNIYYRVHVSDYGWLDWTKDGEETGTVGCWKKIEAVQIRMLRKGSNNSPTVGTNTYIAKTLSVGYQANVQNNGWQNMVDDGAVAGTTGQSKRIESFRLKLQSQNTEGSIEYRAHVSNIGWQNYVGEGSIAGITGCNCQVEAISIRLTGQMAEKYDVYYRVHSADFGWLDWAKNGENAGSEGYGKQVEAFQVELVTKGGAAPGNTGNAFKKQDTYVMYQTHISDIGWQDYVSEGQIAGTTGQRKQVEALRVQIKNKKCTGGVEYRTHVADIGWQNYVSEGKISGTTGKSKQIEAVSIRLTGELKTQYDIYYRVHSADFGWLGWTKNGENAGSIGYAKRIEAVQIKLVKRGSLFDGNIKNSFFVK